MSKHTHSARCRHAGGRAMGDAEAPSVATLAAQVNRFGVAAPAAYRFVTTPYTASDTLTPALALTALTIYLRRATEAYASFHDEGSEQAIAAANAGFANPTGFVTNNLGAVTQAVALFADSLGLPGATSLPFSSTTFAVAAVVAILALVVLR